ncbi:hypothetical protein [Maricaulis sp.]|uniref:hypothetical protein n=1 Tax=Maricaulis sp. TaxID=1486257 RepID=UPI001AFE4A07|nr:hypothetical protein [Maricaulis sp.]MBO6764176.1 hypothetical protein [Maricaulis sp.]
MPHNIALLGQLEAALFDALDEAEAAGLGTEAGRDAFRRAMASLDTTVESRTERLYTPLAADPLTRDYVSHLDGQLNGLTTRIEVLRTHIELGLETGSREFARLDASLTRLARQLKVRFSRESALIPVYFSWCDRHPGDALASA